MTAEQLEDVNGQGGTIDWENTAKAFYRTLEDCREQRDALQRRVIAAERMRAAFEDRLRGEDNATECYMSIIAYLEASK